jgi:hypothetical protein
MRIKTSELTGAALDWAVAKGEGHIDDFNGWLHEASLLEVAEGDYTPSTNWAQGGTIVEREGITVGLTHPRLYTDKRHWVAQYFDPPHSALEVHRMRGPTPLIAAMRCVVASKLGDEIEIPQE